MGTVRWREVRENGQLKIEEIHKVVVHRFVVRDSEDPEIYAAEPILEWQKTEAGEFVMKHAINRPEYKRYMNYETFGYLYSIIAELEKNKLVEFYLKFGQVK